MGDTQSVRCEWKVQLWMLVVIGDFIRLLPLKIKIKLFDFGQI